jgi:hypothetical protein
MKLQNLIPFIAILFVTNILRAQTASKLTWSGYAELYYTLDSKATPNHERAGFLYNHKRNNEINLNLGFIKAAYTDTKTRANMALMAGTYAQYNLAAENQIAQHILEANVGVQLSKKNNIWLDAGVMPSHIGFESAIAQDCWTPSRSLVAENSPYFNTGAKISATDKKGKLASSLLLLNGWQQIQKNDGQNLPSFGAQFNYKPNAAWTLNYSNFIGSAKADSLKALRTYHNFYAVYEPAKKWNLTAGFDIGTEKNSITSIWYTPVIIARYITNNKNAIAARLEYFADKNHIVIGNPVGFSSVAGASINYDYKITPTCYWRTEAKYYYDNSKLNVGNNIAPLNMLTTLSIKF